MKVGRRGLWAGPPQTHSTLHSLTVFSPFSSCKRQRRKAIIAKLLLGLYRDAVYMTVNSTKEGGGEEAVLKQFLYAARIKPVVKIGMK